jgi:hypothetical protein
MLFAYPEVAGNAENADCGTTPAEGAQVSDGKPYHKRLPDFESFDKITLEVVPRYKTSGLSGDEWRQHVEVKFHFKGEIVHSTGWSNMRAALMLLGGEWVRAQEPIPERVIEIEEQTCDQPSCERPPIGRLLIGKETSEHGDWLLKDQDSMRHYRKFCANHIRRGDCSREDADANYTPLDGKTADASTNVEESPSVLGGVIDLEAK